MKFLIIGLIVLGLSIVVYYTQREPAWERRVDSDAIYLDIDSTNRTPEEKLEYKKLKKSFLEHFLDSTNCYLNTGIEVCQTGKKPDKDLKKILKIYVDNIFHTPECDTAVVIVSFYAAWVDSTGKFYGNGNHISTQAMEVTFDSIGNLHFGCKHGSFWAGFETDDTGGYNMERLKIQAKDYRRLLVSYDILDKNKNINKNFFHRFFTEDMKVDKKYGNNNKE